MNFLEESNLNEGVRINEVIKSSSEMKGCSISNLLKNEIRNIWLSNEKFPQTIEIKMNKKLFKEIPKKICGLGILCWHAYLSNPKLIKLYINNNYINAFELLLKEGHQILLLDNDYIIDQDKEQIDIKLIIVNNYGGEKTYINNIFLYENVDSLIQKSNNNNYFIIIHSNEKTTIINTNDTNPNLNTKNNNPLISSDGQYFISESDLSEKKIKKRKEVSQNIINNIDKNVNNEIVNKHKDSIDNTEDKNMLLSSYGLINNNLSDIDLFLNEFKAYEKHQEDIMKCYDIKISKLENEINDIKETLNNLSVNLNNLINLRNNEYKILESNILTKCTLLINQALTNNIGNTTETISSTENNKIQYSYNKNKYIKENSQFSDNEEDNNNINYNTMQNYKRYNKRNINLNELDSSDLRINKKIDERLSQFSYRISNTLNEKIIKPSVQRLADKMQEDMNFVKLSLKKAEINSNKKARSSFKNK